MGQLLRVILWGPRVPGTIQPWLEPRVSLSQRGICRMEFSRDPCGTVPQSGRLVVGPVPCSQRVTPVREEPGPSSEQPLRSGLFRIRVPVISPQMGQLKILNYAKRGRGQKHRRKPGGGLRAHQATGPEPRGVAPGPLGPTGFQAARQGSSANPREGTVGAGVRV